MGAGLFSLVSPALAEEDAKPGAVKVADTESAWRKVLLLIGARVPEDKSLIELLGPLPADTTVKKQGSLTPEEFMAAYQAAEPRVQEVMRLSAVSRLRELSRRGDLERSGVDVLLGPEMAGVHGSGFFGVPQVPGESYQALISYLEFAAARVPGGNYEPSPAGRDRIDRALQASLALSSPQVRMQYWDFDVVWSEVLMEIECREAGSLLPGGLWLYCQLREASGLDWLPRVAEDLEEEVEKEGGALFARARKESRSMPASLAAITWWKCGQ